MFPIYRFALLYILSCGIIFQVNIALAADTCSIQNQASPEFLEYQNKLQAELTKIRSEMSAKNC